MAEGGLNPQQVQYMVAAMQNPQQAMQIQQQQALAQQMMQQGAEQPNPNETINEGIGGAHTVPFNKWGGLARAGEQMTGAYLQNQNNQKLGALMANGQGQQSTTQSPTGDNGQPMPGQLLPWQSNAATGGTGSPAQQPQQDDPNTVTGTRMGDIILEKMEPDRYKMLADIKIADAKKTDLAKNVNNPAVLPYMQKDLYTTGPGGGLVKIGNPQPSSAASGGNINPITPQGNGGQVVLNSNGPMTSESNSAASLVGNSVNSYNPFNPTQNKQKEGMIEGDQKYLNETLLPKKDAAVDANNSLTSLQNAAAIANGNDLTHTGPTAPARLEFFKNVNDFLSSTGGKPFDQNEIAGADTINKVGVRLSAAMTKQLGSREAAQIFDKIQGANPNWAMQPQTLGLVSNLIKADNDTAIGRYNSGYASASKGGMAQDGVNSYDSQNPGAANIKKGFAASGMAYFDNPKDPSFAQMPSGTKFYDLVPGSPTYGAQLTKH